MMAPKNLGAALIRAVFFDVGETLVDETRQWISWAEWLGVRPLTFCAALGAVIERGEHHRRVFDYFAPGIDIASEDAKRQAAGKGYSIEPQDLYPDALPTLVALKAQGLQVGIAGNQPEQAEAALSRAGLMADHLASSARWRIEKPSLRFFEKVAEIASLPPSQIAYVGDRLDNDVVPAREAGMFAVFLVRGPWGVLHARRSDAARASLVIHTLADLPPALARVNGARGSEPRRARTLNMRAGKAVLAALDASPGPFQGRFGCCFPSSLI